MTCAMQIAVHIVDEFLLSYVLSFIKAFGV